MMFLSLGPSLPLSSHLLGADFVFQLQVAATRLPSALGYHLCCSSPAVKGQFLQKSQEDSLFPWM